MTATEKPQKGDPEVPEREGMSLLEVSDLRVSFDTADGVVWAVRGVSFSIDAGRTLGIVGESGSGKSVTAQTLLRLTPGADISGQALFEGQDLLAVSDKRMRQIRGKEIAMIFQDPLSSLHPLYKVGRQIEELLRAHEPAITKRQARRRAVEMLGLVGVPQPDQRVDDYPHQFSGGMRQRAMIAMALALNPKLIIADEPTTALDATIQAQILDLMQRLQREFDTALIMITHDLGVVAGMADDVLVMYAGKPIEYADRRTLYYRQHHPYTKGLLESVPGGGAFERSPGHRGRLKPIPGQPPSLINLPSGCAFHPRCEYAMSVCRLDQPDLSPVSGSADHRSACWLPRDALGMSAEAERMRRQAAGLEPREPDGPEAERVRRQAAGLEPREPDGPEAERMRRKAAGLEPKEPDGPEAGR